jgi:AcrR family transcriptional regulator
VKERILEEATRLFTERGYHGMSMRDLAEACGVTKAALYYHFRDKNDLFLAILQGYLGETSAAVRLVRQQGGSATRQIRKIVGALFQQRPEQRAVIRLSMQESRNLEEAQRASFAEMYHSEFTGQIEAVLNEGIANGELHPFDATRYTWILLGMIFPFLTRSAQGGKDDEEETVQAVVDVFFQGCALGR